MEEIWNTYVAGDDDLWDFDIKNENHRLKVMEATLYITHNIPPHEILHPPTTLESEEEWFQSYTEMHEHLEQDQDFLGWINSNQPPYFLS